MSAVPGYVPRRPEETVLHAVVSSRLETFLDRQRRGDRLVPRFVERELRDYLACGILAHGLLRVHCDECGKDRLVAYSCKGRGFCPSYGGRRMADTAAHLVDRVFPVAPIRQWVLSLPFALRYHLAYDADLLRDILRVFVGSIVFSMRRRAGARHGLRRTRPGAVTFVQRFGGALNLNVHFHTLALDGVYSSGDDARFFPLPPPDDAEVAGTRGRRCAEVAGLSVHAAVAVSARDRARLERLCRYVARPPLATERLSRLLDGRVLYALRHRRRDGTTRVAFEPLDFIAKLAALVPPPRVHRVRYPRRPRRGGAPPLADRAGGTRSRRPALAARELPLGRPALPASRGKTAPARTARRIPRPRNDSWAELMQRVFALDVLECPACRGRLRLLAAIRSETAIRAILECLGLPSRAPPIAAAEPEPEVDGGLEFDRDRE